MIKPLTDSMMAGSPDMKNNDDELMKLLRSMETVIDHLPFDVWLKDADGKYVVANKNFETYTGKTKQELIGKSDYDIYPAVEADLYVASDHAAIQGNIQDSYEFEYQEGRFKEGYKQPVFDEDGTLIGTTGYSKDITERKKIQDALIESERSKAVLISNLPGVAYRSNNDADFTMTFISEGCFELTGYTSDQLRGKSPSYYELIHPAYRDKLFQKWREYTGLNIISPDEYPIITANGDVKWVWEQSQEIYDSRRNMVATEGLIIDITERKLAEEALRQSEERFRTMFEEAPLGMGIFDAQTGAAYDVNTRYAEIIGRTKEEALTSNWMQYTHPDDIKENLYKTGLLNSGRISSFSMDKRFVMPDGAVIWVNVTVASFRHGESGSTRLLYMVEDINERKQSEEEIRYLSFYDQLTGLYNRRFYEQELRRIDKPENLPITLILADINGLKLINDAFGHLEGDLLLKEFAAIIKNECKNHFVAARTGGDEFNIILPKTDSAAAKKMVERMHHAFFRKKIHNITCSSSFGWETKKDASEDVILTYMQAEDRMYRHKLSDSARLRKDIVREITKTLFEKNEREKKHCERVSQLCEKIGLSLQMSLDDINDLKLAGLMHDIGKIGISEHVLRKQGQLTESERAEMKKHPEIGYHILRTVDEYAPIAEYVLYHHERIDGNGYPRGLKGDEINLQSKIISIADAYDSMTNERFYKSTLNMSDAIEEIKQHAGSKYDPSIVYIFVEKVLGS
jgi:diguanylate cyclase (GGDEF)-like protein/PAS domain S-box-containing protein